MACSWGINRKMFFINTLIKTIWTVAICSPTLSASRVCMSHLWKQTS